MQQYKVLVNARPTGSGATFATVVYYVTARNDISARAEAMRSAWRDGHETSGCRHCEPLNVTAPDRKSQSAGKD